jgi:hypothetical protein
LFKTVRLAYRLLWFIILSRKSFKSVSAGEDTYSLLQDMGIEFGIKLNCDGAADWSGCQSDGMGAPTVCSAFVGCGMI